jgi:hypothetical protein
MKIITRRQAVDALKHGIQLRVLVLHEHAEMVDGLRYVIHTVSLARTRLLYSDDHYPCQSRYIFLQPSCVLFCTLVLCDK